MTVAGEAKSNRRDGKGSVSGLTLTPFLVYLLEKVGDDLYNYFLTPAYSRIKINIIIIKLSLVFSID
jgi:hypothetical protein